MTIQLINTNKKRGQPRKLFTIDDIIVRSIIMPNGCWEWQGAMTGQGYGVISRKIGNKVKNIKAYRLAYELFIGNIPKNSPVVRHKCDNRKCVNPCHLEIGTQTDNNKDMYQRGRCRGAPGERNNKAKLSKKQVEEIRSAYVYGDKKFGQNALAQKYNVNVFVINRIVNMRGWL